MAPGGKKPVPYGPYCVKTRKTTFFHEKIPIPCIPSIQIRDPLMQLLENSVNHGSTSIHTLLWYIHTILIPTLAPNIILIKSSIHPIALITGSHHTIYISHS